MEAVSTSRQRQAIRTKNKIFNTAISLIERQGFAGMNIEDICKAANVSVGTFYYYFKSKNDVFLELYKRADQHFREVVRDCLLQEHTVDRVLEFFDQYAAYCESRGIETIKQLMHPENKNFIKKGRYMQELLISTIREGQDKGDIDNGADAEQLCEDLFIFARGIVFDWCLHDGGYDLREKVRRCFSAVIYVMISDAS